MIETRCTDVELRWRASPLTRAIASCAGVALAAAVIGSRWQLIVFAAPLLGVLCSISWQRPVPKVQVHAQARLAAMLRNRTDPAARMGHNGTGRRGRQTHARGARRDATRGPREGFAPAANDLSGSPTLGPIPIQAQVDVVARGGLLAGTATVDAADVIVFPVAPAQSTAIPPTELPDRLGAHLTRHTGAGVEYADIRAYVPGDQLRTVNWPVSARRGRLHVTQRLTDRAADVVVLIDTYAQPSGPATDATERTVRGAAQVVQTALRSGDRAGIVALGGDQPRWLGADIGQRQFYRVLDAVLGAGDGFETTTGTLAPRAAIPPGAIVVAFSTLLDTEFALALIDLRKRGHVVVAVDVLQGSPFEDEHDPLMARMWQLQRSGMYRDMATIGVDVVSWRADSTLDQSIQLVPDRRHPVWGRR